MNLPPIAKKEHLTCHWFYRNTNRDAIALVTRHDNLSNGQSKKWFHQYHLDSNGNWVEGAVTPSPLFGIDTLPKIHSDQKIYIFEGEKCTQAAHHLDLPAITSMRGANQSHLADWAILAQYRHLKNFVWFQIMMQGEDSILQQCRKRFKKHVQMQIFGFASYLMMRRELI